MLKFRVFLLAFLGVLLVLFVNNEAKAQAIWVCSDVGSSYQDFNPDFSKCAPRDLTWTVGFRFPGEDVAAPAGTYRIRFFWDFGNNTADFTVVNAVWNNSKGGYEATGTRTYPQNGVVCTYELLAALQIVGQGVCGNSDARLPGNIVVFDDISNANIGTHDVNHDPTSTGFENGETVEVCLEDTNPVRLIDSSTFNCTNPFETVPANQNDEYRWVQWVYGSTSNITTGAAADEKIIIDGVSFDASDLPIYGEVEYLAEPVLAPNSITNDIQMPTSANVGETFIVSLRSWNTCNPYDEGGGTSPDPSDDNPVRGGPFTVGPNPGGNWLAGTFNPANTAPIIRNYTIEIVAQPVAPTPFDKEFCDGTNLNSNPAEYFQVDIPGAFIDVFWYQDNAGSPGALITTNNSEVLDPAIAGVNGSSTGVNTVWVQYSANNGSQICTSDFTSVDITIRSDLNNPGAISSTTAFPVCADSPNITFEVPDDPNDPPVAFGGTWEYFWSFGGGTLNDNLSFVGSRTGRTVVVDITSNAASGNRRIRVRKRFTTNDDNGSECYSGFTNFDFTIDPTSLGGTPSAGATVCSGGATGDISLAGERGLILRWEKEIDGGGFVTVPGSAGLDPLPSQPLTVSGFVSETHTYRAVVQSGSCASANSATVDFFVDPVPSTPTIAEAPGPIEECSGTVVTLNASSDAAANSYQWYRDGAPIGGATSAAYVVSNPANDVAYTYTVEAVGTNTSCTSGLSAPIDVTIFSLPEVTGVTGGGAVCSGNPAPDIVWDLTGAAPFTIDYNDGTNNFVGVVEPTNQFTVSNPTVIGTYQITSVTDNNGCDATVLGPTASVTLGGNAPSLDTPFSLDITEACDDGGSTTDPNLLFSLVQADVISPTGFILNYTVDGSANRVKNFDVDASGDPTAAVAFNDAELNNTAPSPHTILIVSIESPEGCLTTFNDPLSFTVNPRPSVPANPVDGIACSNPGTGVPLTVDAPGGATEEIRWFTNAGLTVPVTGADGVVSGTKDNTFTPNTSATNTYYAATIETTTSCLSATGVALTQTQDQAPTAATVDPDFNTCNTSETINATTAVVSGFGEWVFNTGLFWREGFDDNQLGAQSDGGSTAWTLDTSNDANGGTFEVTSDAIGKKFVINNPGGSGSTTSGSGIYWISEAIDVSSATNDVTVSVEIEGTGLNGATDWIQGWYTLDGSIPVPGAGVPNWFGPVQNNTGGVIPQSVTIPNGSLGAGQLRLLVQARNGGPSEFHYIDNVEVREELGSPIPTITGAQGRYTETVTVNGLLESEIVTGANEFTWTVYSDLGACPPNTATITITRWSLPEVVDTTPSVCDDVFGAPPSATIPDLTVYDAGVIGTGPPADRTVTYYDDPGRTPADIVTSIVVTDVSNVVYTRVTRTDVTPNCTSDGTLTFTIQDLPETIDLDDATTTFCEDFPVGSGTVAGINLTSYDAAVSNSQPDRSVAWFTDPGYSVAVPDPTNANATDGTIFYPRVTETASGLSCFDDATVTINVNPRPVDNPIIGPDTQCVGSSIELYQITPGPVGTTYTWTIPPQFTLFGGGGVNDFFVLLSFPAVANANVTVVETSPEGCDGNVQTKNIDVVAAPPPLTITGPDPVCSNESGLTYDVANLPNTTYAWTVPVGWSIIAGQGTFEITVNAGSTGGTISVTPTSITGSCAGTPANLAVTVNDRPILDPSLDKTVCSDNDIEITLGVDGGSPVAASTYDITASVAPGIVANTGPTTGNGLTQAAIFNDNFRNTTGGPLDVTYTVTPISADNCSGAPVNVIVTIDPEPVMATGLDVTACSDQAIGMTLGVAVGSVAAPTYNVTAVSIPGTVTAGVGNAIVPQNGVILSYLQNDTYENVGATPAIVQYTVVPISATGCEGDPLVINATINPEPVVSITLDDSECSDVAIGLILDTNGVSIAAATYDIINVSVPGGLAPGGGNVPLANGVAANYLSGDTYTNQTINPLVVTYTVRGVSAAGCVGDDRLINITINPEPVMSAALDNTVCSDDAVGVVFATQGFAVAANDYNLVDVTIPAGLIAGANALFPANNVADNYVAADTYTNPTGASLDVVYEVRGVSADGCIGDSEFITITVNPEPVIDPALDATVCSDVAIGLTLNTDGTSVAAASYEIVDVTIPVGLTPGAGNAIFPQAMIPDSYVSNDTYSNVTNATLNVTYEVRAVSADGCQGDSEFILISVDPEPVISTGLSTTVCSDAPIGVTFATNGVSVPAASYNLIDVTIPVGVTAGGGNASFPAILAPSGYIASDTYTNQTNNPINVIYEVSGISGAGCVGDSEFITVTINPEPVIDPGLDATVCSDDAIALTLNTNGSSVAAANYNIIDVTVPVGLAAAGGNATIPANSVPDVYLSLDSYTNQTTGALDVIYEVRGVSAIGCVGDSEFITITINPEPIVNTTLDNTVCSDEATGLILDIEAGSTAAANYNIVDVTVPGGLTASGGNAVVPNIGVGTAYLSLDEFTNQTAAALTVIYEVRAVSVDGCAGDSEFINITINPEPVINPALDVTVCSDANIGVTLSNNGASVLPADYDVLSVLIPGGVTAGGSNAVIPGLAVANNYINADTYTNQTSGALNVVYEVRGTSAAGCVGDSEFITVTIDPEPVISTSLDNTICSDEATGLVLNTNGTSVGAAAYNIIGVSIDAGLTSGVNAVIPANGVADNYLDSDTYTNQTNGALTVTYEVRGVSADACVGDSEFIVITINPEPVVSTTLDATVCSDENIGLTLDVTGTSIAAVSYNIINVTIPGTVTADAGNATVPASGQAAAYLNSDRYTNTTNATQVVIYEVRGVSANGCEGDSELISITINPEPVISTTLDNTVCSGLPVSVTLATNGTSVAAADYDVVDVTIPVGLTPGANAAIPGNGVASSYIFTDTYINQTAGPLDVVYEVLGNSAAGCSGDSEFITVTINPEPVIDPGLDTSVCSDATVGVVLNTNGTSVAALNYNIVNVNIPVGLTASGSNAAIPANGVTDNYFSADVYTNITNGPLDVEYTVRGVSAAGCIGPAQVITVTINPEPVVSTTLNSAACSDDAIGLTLDVSPTSVGAANYNIINVTIPGGITPAAGNAAFPANGVAAGYLAADSYTNQTSASIGVIYEVQGVSGLNCVGDTRSIIILITPEPVINPGLDVTVCSDVNTGITLATDGASIGAANYDIVSISIPAGVTPNVGNSVVPATGVGSGYIFADAFTNQTAGSLDVVYEVRGTSAAGCTGDSEMITVTIDPEPVIDPALDNTVCSDDVVGVVLATNGTSVTANDYNIIGVTIDPSLVAGGGNVAIPANNVAANYFTNDTYTNLTNGTLDVVYEVRGVSAAGCIGDSELITVSIDPEPVVSTTLNTTVCSDDVIGLTLLTEPTSVGASTYNIIGVSVDPGLAPAPTNATIPSNGEAAGYLSGDIYTNQTGGVLNVVYEVRGVSAAGCVGNSRFITVTINPEPIIDPALDMSVCSDLAIGLIFASDGVSVTATTFNLVNVNVGVGLTPGGFNVVPANGIGANYAANDVYNNITNVPVDVIYEVQGISAAGCVGDSEFITITIDPEPVMNTGLSTTVCSDVNSGITLSSDGVSVTASTFNIVDVTIPGGLTPGGGNGAFPANNVNSAYISNDTYTNQTNAAIVVTYEVQGVSAAGCIGDSEFINLTIDPEPVINTGLDATVCSDNNTGLTLSTNGTSVAAANYNILAVSIDVGLVANPANQPVPANGVAAAYLSADSYTNQTAVQLNVVYDVQGVSLAGCLGDVRQITITIDPEPVVSPALDRTVCSDATTALILNTDGVSVSANSYNLIGVTIDPGLTANASNVAVPAASVASRISIG